MQPASETINEIVDALPATTSGWPPPPSAPSSSDASFWSSHAGQAVGADWRQFLDIEAGNPELQEPEVPDREVPDPGLPASLESGPAPGSMGTASIFDLLPVPNDDLLPNW